MSWATLGCTKAAVQQNKFAEQTFSQTDIGLASAYAEDLAQGSVVNQANAVQFPIYTTN
jgi:hypothetical protein